MLELAKTKIKQGNYQKAFEKLYPIGIERQPERYLNLIDGFEKEFGKPENEIRLFSSPGRTEIGGNHTDHQHFRVLAAAVHLDTAAVAAKTDDNIIKIYSEGHGLTEIKIDDLSVKQEEKETTSALIRGICARLKELDYSIGGFTAYCTSDVPVGSGLSSSASFENLITTILSGLYNDGGIPAVTIAQIGQYAENNYFGKPSGLMDQAASAVGDVITIDFKDNDNPEVEFLSLNLADYGYTMCIVNTGGDHADLTNEYADIFNEIKEVANYFDKDVLREVDEKEFYNAVPKLRELFDDRGILRSIHVFEDNERVVKQVEALKKGDFDTFKSLVIQSGVSSSTQLQNIYSTRYPKQQPISLALALSQHLLESAGGAWRIHGGGFAGTIQTYVPNNMLEDYKKEMDRVFGENATVAIAIRSVGSTEVKEG